MKIITIKEFAQLIKDIQKTDRWVFAVCTGDMGVGKSCITSQIAEETAKVNNTPFSYHDNMTFLRKELKTWVDGDEKGENQKPERSSILADELISMFFKRNWFDSEQIDGIELLNKCRDRHLLVEGNVPNFWDLDSAIYPMINFWLYVEERGVCHILTKDDNPFVLDKWHKKYNEKIFAKTRKIDKCKGYIGTIFFNDWTPEKKREYYAVRNSKRKNTEGQRTRTEKYGDIKKTRDALIRLVFSINPELTNKDLHDIIPELSAEAIRLIRIGER